MKRVIALIIGVFVWVSLIAMIPKVKTGNPEKRAERIAAFLKQKLGLTDEQTQKIKAVELETLTKIRSIRQNQALATDSKLEQLVEVRKDQFNNICQILTSEQKANFETNHKQWFQEFHQQMRKMYFNKKGEPRCLLDSAKMKAYQSLFLEKIAQELNLTPEQTEKIKAIRKEQHQRIAQLRSRSNTEDKQTLRLQLHEIRQQTQKRILEEVLTPEQAARAEEKIKAIRQQLKLYRQAIKNLHCDSSSNHNNSKLKKLNIPNNFDKANVYPNPANKTAQVVLSLTNPTEVVLQIIDKTGQKRVRQSFGLLSAGEVTLSIDLSQLPADTYTIQAIGEGSKLLMSKQLIFRPD